MSKLARMHTAEHLLSAVMRKFYAAPRNLEFHLNEKKTKCDYATPAELTDADIREIERLVNHEIANKHDLSAFNLARHEATKYDLWQVPGEIDEIRIVQIGDFDEQPCRGQHVANTEEIGHFEISSYEQRENGRVRIRFKVF